MRLADFEGTPSGWLVGISGLDQGHGEWSHSAFVPRALSHDTPALTASTFNLVASARAALASLDSSARQLPNPSLLRQPALRREAQSTSALEGTYAPLQDVLGADESEQQDDAALREVLNYVRVAEHAFAWHADGRPLASILLTELHAALVRGTAADGAEAGRIRGIQVVVGGRHGGRVQDARFVPHPPGPELDRRVQELLAWIETARTADLDPVVAAGMAHYQFETLHPFNDGNGRIGRLLVVLQLLYSAVLSEPTLTVSPWFEARRADYYDALMAVSTHGDWDRWIGFFARGIAASAAATELQLHDLIEAQALLRERIRAAGLRAERAMQLVDFAVAQPYFTVRQVQRHLRVSYPRANGLVGQLIDIGVLRQVDDATYDRRFAAPDVLAVLLRD